MADEPENLPQAEWEREMERRRRSRNIALAVLLFALVGLFYVITILRLGGRGG